jgi:FkbM family methyltransferase
MIQMSISEFVPKVKHHLESLFIAISHPKIAWLRLRRSADLRIAMGLNSFSKKGYLRGVTRVYDVGANVGLFAKTCAVLFKHMEITCFEPVPATYEVLKRECGIIPRIQVEQLAIGEGAGVQRMHTSGFDQADSLLKPGKELLKGWSAAKPSGYVDVKVVALDDYVQEKNPEINIFLKIDVQGYELFVLKGAEKTLKQCRCIQVEVSIMEMYQEAPKLPDVWQFLTDHGFELAEIFGILRSPQHGLPVSCDLLFLNNGNRK